MDDRVLLELTRALRLRQGLGWQALRLMDTRHPSRGDSLLLVPRHLKGVVVDRFGPAVVVALYDPAVPVQELVHHLGALQGVRAVFVKERFRNAELKLAWGSVDVPYVIEEEGLLFEVDPSRGITPGLFLETRPLRRELRLGLLRGRRVLNLFSYTASLGVAAMVGGARFVVNVDSSGSALRRARRNYRLNGLDGDPQSFAKSDVMKRLRRWRAKGARFDAIICDPPPYMPGGGSGTEWLASRRDLLLSLLEEDGVLILISHDPSITWESFLKTVGLGGRRIFPDMDVWHGIGNAPTKILVHVRRSS